MSADAKYGDVTVEVGDDHVATVTVNRPPDNYFDAALISSLADAYEALDRDPRCRAIVLRSDGRHFCAGAALRARGNEGPTEGFSVGDLYEEAIRMYAADTPVVAAVQGAAIGGGLGLALSADFRVGVPEARLSANFARLGFHHGFGLTVTLPDAIGQQRALELLLTGVRVKGEDALAMGLLDRLVTLDELDNAARAFAMEIAASGPLAVTSIRRTMRAGLVSRIRAATAHERSEQDRLARTTDFAEGVRATAERRPPNFEGR